MLAAWGREAAIAVVAVCAMVPQVAAAQECPAFTHLDRVERHGNVRTVHCKCDDGYQARNGRCEIKTSPEALPDLAHDPEAARLNAAQLDVVNRRIAGLQRAIVLLSDDNPEWSRERNRLLEDTHEDAVGLSLEAFNLVTLGVAKWAQVAAKLNVDRSRSEALAAALKEPLARLPAEEARLKRIMATTRDPAVTKAIVEYLTLLHRLRSAQHSEKVVEMAKQAYEACDLLRTEMELTKEKTSTDKAANALYVSSATLGGIALIFVADGPPAVAAAIGSFGSSVAVGGRELANLWEERERLRALDQSASARETMRHDLMQRVGALQEERERLMWAVQRAR